MLHKEFWGLVFLSFVVWVVVLAGTPTKRIERVCRPIGWGGNVVTSLAALVLPSQQKNVQGWFDKLEYGCRYTTWRLFYQDEYNAWLAKQDGAPPVKAQTPPLESFNVDPAKKDPVEPKDGGTPKDAKNDSR